MFTNSGLVFSLPRDVNSHRQPTNLTHELSHTLLEHRPRPLAGRDGLRYWNSEVEAEATWLGAALLVPRSGWLEMVKARCSVSQIEQHYGSATPFAHHASSTAASMYKSRSGAVRLHFVLISFSSFSRRVIIESKESGSTSNMPSAIIFS
jgi:IrrE N-terminal-like domain